MRHLILTAISIVLFTANFIYSQVTIKLNQPPPNQLNIADLWTFTLFNSSDENLEVYLKGTAVEEKDGLIATGKTVNITLKAKETKNMKVSDLPKTPEIDYTAKNPKYKESLIRQGKFPAGSYEICVNVFSSGINEELGSDCINQEVQESGILSLINPSDGQEIDKKMSLIFTWSYSGKMPDGGYTLKIVEMKKGQTPEGAMERNKAFFEKEEIKATAFSYPLNAPKFEEGKSYAWGVKSGEVKSEVWGFSRSIDSITLFCNNPDPDFCPGNYFMNGNFEEITGDPNANTDQDINLATGWRAMWGNSSLADLHCTNGSKSTGTAPTPNSNIYAGMWIENTTTTNTTSNTYREGMYNKLETPISRTPIRTYSFNFNIANAQLTSDEPVSIGIYGVYNPDAVLAATPTGSNANPTNVNLWTSADPSVEVVLLGIITTPVSFTNTWSAQSISFNSSILPSNGITHIMITADDNARPSSYRKIYINFDDFCMRESEIQSDPCDSFSAEIFSNVVQSGCCWSLNLQHPQNTSDVRAINIFPLSPTTFITSSVIINSSSVFANTINSNLIEILPNYPNVTFPPGTMNDVLSYCLNFMNSPQQMVISWMGGQNNDSVICSDTVESYCEIPCVIPDSVDVECDGDNYNIEYSFTNISHFPFDSIEYTVLSPTGITVAPSLFNLSPDVSPSNTGSAEFSITGAQPNTQVCVQMKYISPDTCCWCFDTLCILIPECICDTTTLNANLKNEDPYNCCYDVTIKNLNVNNFDQLQLETLDPGVFFRERTMSAGWVGSAVPSVSPTLVNIFKTPVWTTPVPNGNNISLLNFCLGGYSTSPQTLVLRWIRNDSIMCTDTLKTNCIPPPPTSDTCAQIFNDTLICNSDGTFTYNFQVLNSATWIAQGLKLSVSTPTGLTITPSDFNVNILPDGVSPVLSTNISGVTPNSNICFKVGLYDHTEAWSNCCFSDDYCLTVPLCGSFDCNFDIKIDSITCKEINPTGNPSYKVWSSINNLTGGSALIQKVVPNTFVTNPSSTLLNPGLNNFSFTYSGPQVNPLCFVFKVIRPDLPSDTCEFKVCGKLPDCKLTGCECGNWKDGNTTNVTINGKKSKVECNSTITGKLNDQFSFSLPTYSCKSNCEASYLWTIKSDEVTPPIIINGTGQIANHLFNTPGTYILNYDVFCGNRKCDSCQIIINIEPPDKCKCGEWINMNYSIETTNPKLKADDLKKKLNCNDTISLKKPTNISINYGYACIPKDCKSSIHWKVEGPISGNGIGNSGFHFNFSSPGIYSVILSADCNGKSCPPCTLVVKVEKKPTGCDCLGWEGNSVTLSNNGQIHSINFGSTFSQTLAAGSYTVSAPNYNCGDPHCMRKYSYRITKNDVDITLPNSYGQSFSFNFAGPILFPVKYKIQFFVYCNPPGSLCGESEVTFWVRKSFKPIDLGKLQLLNLGVKNPNVSPTLFNPNSSLRPDFKWENSGGSNNIKLFRLIEIAQKDGLTNLADIENELVNKVPYFEVNTATESLNYPSSFPDLIKGEIYLWIVYEINKNGETTLLDGGIFQAGNTTEHKFSDSCEECEYKCQGGRCFEFKEGCICITRLQRDFEKNDY